MNGSARAGGRADAGVLIPVLAAVMVLAVMREAMAIAGLTVATARLGASYLAAHPLHQVQVPHAPAPVPVPALGRRDQAGAAAAGHPRAGP